jgi:hypothetical protein
MAVNLQKPHEVALLIDAQLCKLRAQLLGAVVRREAGEAALPRLHFRCSVKPKESAECGRAAFLKLLGPLAAELAP